MREVLVTSSILILVILVLRFVLKGKMNLRLQYALWGIVLLRLLIPVSLFHSSISVMNVVPEKSEIHTVQTTQNTVNQTSPQVVTPTTSNQTEMVSSIEPAVIANDSVKQNASTNFTFDTVTILRLIWLAGALTVSITFIVMNLLFNMKLKKRRMDLNQKMGPVKVYQAENLVSPCLAGLFKPSIYVDRETLDDKIKCKHILAHEMTHFYHLDFVWSFLRCVCVSLYWFHPLVWVAAIISKHDAELACDEGTIKRLGEEERFGYGITLIDMMAENRGTVHLLNMATTMSSEKKVIRQRINFIVKKPKFIVMSVILLVMVLSITILCTFTNSAASEETIQSTEIENIDKTNVSGEVKEEVNTFDKEIGDAGKESIKFYKENKEANKKAYVIYKGNKYWCTGYILNGYNCLKSCKAKDITKTVLNKNNGYKIYYETRTDTKTKANYETLLIQLPDATDESFFQFDTEPESTHSAFMESNDVDLDHDGNMEHVVFDKSISFLHPELKINDKLISILEFYPTENEEYDKRNHINDKIEFIDLNSDGIEEILVSDLSKCYIITKKDNQYKLVDTPTLKDLGFDIQWERDNNGDFSKCIVTNNNIGFREETNLDKGADKITNLLNVSISNQVLNFPDSNQTHICISMGISYSINTYTKYSSSGRSFDVWNRMGDLKLVGDKLVFDKFTDDSQTN